MDGSCRNGEERVDLRDMKGGGWARLGDGDRYMYHGILFSHKKRVK